MYMNEAYPLIYNEHTWRKNSDGTKASHCYSQHSEHHHHHPSALLAHWLTTVARCIIHQPDFEGLFSEEMTSLKKKKITYGPQHQRGATALGFISEHESSGGRQLSWLWFGRCDASQDTVRINEMSRSKELSKNTQHFINCTSGTFYVLGKQRRQMDFMFHCWSKSGSQDFSLSSITNQRLPPIMWSSDASLAWQYWHVMQFSISWISKSSKNSIL